MEYTNTGALFTNSYKKSDKQPDFKGNITLERSLIKQLLSDSDDENIKINLSGWNRQGRNGDFVSLAYDAYKKPEESAPAKYAAPKPKQQESFDDSDVPF
jgi:hypothetical protein